MRDECTQKLLEQLEALKEEQPELMGILEKFGMDVEEYDRAMLEILAGRLPMGNTAGTDATTTTTSEESTTCSTTTLPHFESCREGMSWHWHRSMLRYRCMCLKWWWRRVERRVRKLDEK